MKNETCNQRITMTTTPNNIEEIIKFYRKPRIKHKADTDSNVNKPIVCTRCGKDKREWGTFHSCSEVELFEHITQSYEQGREEERERMRKSVEEYFGHIYNRGDGKPANISAEEIANDMLSLTPKQD